MHKVGYFLFAVLLMVALIGPSNGQSPGDPGYTPSGMAKPQYFGCFGNSQRTPTPYPVQHPDVRPPTQEEWQNPPSEVLNSPRCNSCLREMFAKQAKLIRFPVYYPEQRIPTWEEKERDSSHWSQADSSPPQTQTPQPISIEEAEDNQIAPQAKPHPSFVHKGVRYASYKEFKALGKTLEGQGR